MKLFSTAIILLFNLFYLAATSDVPDAPIITSISCNKKDAMFSWTPQGDNGEQIKGYSIQYNTSFAPNVWKKLYNFYNNISVSNIESFALPPGVKRSFRVIVWNDIGSSEPSQPSEICITTPDVPYNNPGYVRVKGTKPDNLVIRWTPMPEIEHHAPGFHYRVYWRREGNKEFNVHDVPDWKQSSIVIEDQPSYQLYHIRVLALNELGEANVFPDTVTGYSGENEPMLSPTNFIVKKIISPTSALVAWDSIPPDSVRGPLMGYKLKTWVENGTHRGILVPPHVQSILLTNLIPQTKNYVQVRVSNSKYDGPPSKTINIDTPEDAPGPISSLIAKPSGETSLLVQWKKPKYPNGVITGYGISYARMNRPKIVGRRYIVSINDPNQQEIELAALEMDAVYFVFGTAFNAAGESSPQMTKSRTGPSTSEHI